MRRRAMAATVTDSQILNYCSTVQSANNAVVSFKNDLQVLRLIIITVSIKPVDFISSL